MNWKRPTRPESRKPHCMDLRRFCRACGAPIIGKHPDCDECRDALPVLRSATLKTQPAYA